MKAFKRVSFAQLVVNCAHQSRNPSPVGRHSCPCEDALALALVDLVVLEDEAETSEIRLKRVLDGLGLCGGVGVAVASVSGGICAGGSSPSRDRSIGLGFSPLTPLRDWIEDANVLMDRGEPKTSSAESELSLK